MTPGDRRPWLPVALLLLQVPGCSSLSGPTSMTGTVGGSLSVQCQYEEKFRDIAKYWCKSPCLGDIVKIEKSDKEVRNGRVSIRNHPVNLTFTVTLENLTEGDAGTYRCGIDTSWLPGYLLDVTFHVVVSVTPGSLSLSGPSTVMGTVGGSLRVQCRYEEKYKTFTKYWCRQPCLPLWNQTVATRGSEEEMRSGRVSIVDHPGDLTFTVTLENLTVDDTGKYRCGIATILHEEGLHGFLPDLFFQVQVFVSPRPQWATCGTQSRPDEDKRRPSLSIDILSRDTATQTRGGRTSDPKPSISSHLIAKNW
ncbi:CMRF35-like molecule 6 isoform X3 [Zalophus californianus]|uniref:CMRF35-like molecule 6 isoform X3 n=1 Tax=Zalophus californianus TaxID=9704 RepID=A0A6J2FJX1_ZALCA|nr:CMRF35-like molecule 6 isoform X3 [Zalophus californianus]